MTENTPRIRTLLPEMSEAARRELTLLGVRSSDGQLQPAPPGPARQPAASAFNVSAISAPTVLNEAFAYDKPSSFSRGLTLDLGGYRVLLISGTASIDDEGRTVYVGDFAAQCWRTYRNIATLLGAEGANWHDVVRTTCYLRDIERDYAAFNRIRTSFFDWMGLDPIPASVGIQMRLCRDDLLIEIEALAVIPTPAAR
jgi:2-iminobutanoate/2-iminopropanoate deaminase